MMKFWNLVKKHRVKSLIIADIALVALVASVSDVKTSYISTETLHVVQYNVDVAGVFTIDYFITSEKVQ